MTSIDAAEPKPIIVWIGRFLHGGGYGVATRGIFRALRNDPSLITIGIDVQTGRPIDDHFSNAIQVTTKGDEIVLSPRDGRSPILSVFLDVPEQWRRLVVKGRVHSVGYTMTETEQIPFGWSEEMLAMHQVWTPTHFNRQTFSAAGIPENMISVVPLSADPEIFKPRPETLDLVHANSFRFLSVVSNFNRKDVGSLIRAYASAFTSQDDVSLVLKLPSRTSDFAFNNFVTEAVYPWVDLANKNTPHVLILPAQLSDEKMIDLFASCHAYVSLERGKGWDLPALEAMLMGLPTLSVNWGANTEFQNGDNSTVVSAFPKTMFASEQLVENINLYSGHTWAWFNVADASKGLKDIREKYGELHAQAIKDRQEIVDLVDEKNVCRIIKDYISGLKPFNYRSNEPAELTFTSAGSNVLDTTTKYSTYENIPKDAKNKLDKKFSPPGDANEWTSVRRKLWSQYGPILPSKPQQRRIIDLKDKYLGQSMFVLGNGPSLNKVDFSALKNHYTFATNKIYYLFDRTNWRPDFYTTLDWRVSPDNYEEVNSLKDMTFFFPNRFHGLLREGDDVYWYESLSPGRKLLEKFEPNIENGVRGGGTVLTAALQIAYYLGFRQIFLVGVDASYSIPDTVRQSGGDRFGTGVQINLESTQNDDINHFDPRYFGKGAKWHDPNVDEMMRGFQASYRAIDFLGGKLYNATHGGNLDCVPRISFEEAIAMATKKPG